MTTTSKSDIETRWRRGQGITYKADGGVFIHIEIFVRAYYFTFFAELLLSPSGFYPATCDLLTEPGNNVLMYPTDLPVTQQLYSSSNKNVSIF